MSSAYECDSCGYEASGYSKKELTDDGWHWHPLRKGKTFVMCGDCTEEYAKRRQAKVAA
jgi:NADH:ubiquinone oxidoreductase subunit C